MELVTYKVIGQSPLLMNNPASMLEPKGEGLKVKKIPTAEEDAKSKAYRTKDGQLYIPAISFRAALIEAQVGRKIGKLSARRAYCASVFTAEQQCLLFDPKNDKPIHDYEIDVRRAVVQRQGIPRARPLISKWACYLAFEVDLELMRVSVLTDGLQVAGRLAGVMDFRVSKNGEFGRFTVDLMK